MKNKKTGDANTQTGQHKPDETKTLVHGAIQVHASPDLIEQHIAERKEDAAHKKDEADISKWTLWAVIVYAGLTLILVILSACNNIIARNAMRLSQRPWVGLENIPVAIIASPIRFDDKGNASMDVQLSAKNYSNYAAQNVTIIGELWLSNNAMPVLDAEKDTCAERRIGSKDIGEVIFSGSAPIVHQWTDQAQVFRDKTARPELNAFFVGCVHYRDQFGYPYHTSFRYRLNKIEDPGHAVRIEPTPNIEVKGIFTYNGGSID